LYDFRVSYYEVTEKNFYGPYYESLKYGNCSYEVITTYFFRIALYCAYYCRVKHTQRKAIFFKRGNFFNVGT